MTSIVPSQCNACVRLRDNKTTCDAFPAGIPQFMLTQLGDHRDRLPGDQGLQFEQLNTLAAHEAYDLWKRVSGA